MSDPGGRSEDRADRRRAEIERLLAYPKVGPLEPGAIARNLGVDESEIAPILRSSLTPRPSPAAAGEGRRTPRRRLSPLAARLERAPLAHRDGRGAGGEGIPPHRIELRAHASRYCVYGGRSLLVTGIDGFVSGAGLEGFYFENTRLLCRESLTVGGAPAVVFAASPVGGDALLAYATLPNGPPGPEPALFATFARFVGDGLRTSLRIDNY
ncbi:MAG TPA: glycogen debranching N-terminal domain-containing protein, partial [Thermomicrobiales bacterium]|nr:glycogen debranching N-terminal domain-containing protein [Thermomicrobiales bacterium]